MKAALLGSFVFSILLALINSEVTVLKSVQVLYDKSPKLRIRGSGFTAEDHDIKLTLGSSVSDLRVDKDYLVTKDEDGDGIILKLLGAKRWVDLTGRTPPISLILSSVSFAPDERNLLEEPVIIAQVLNTPSVDENLAYTVYQTASNVLRINGTGFVGAKKVDLYFQPPLTKEVAYEDVSQYPLSKNEIELRLRHGYTWRDDEGPLSIVGVDTGGGAVRLNGDDGIEVAYVQGNLDAHKVTVDNLNKRIYADEAELVLAGSGFNAIGNLLRFNNGLLGNNVNYTTISTSPTQISLRLVPNSFWRANFENLPGALTLLAVDAGEGFVAMGPLNSGKGKDVAIVFERPQVYTDSKKVFRTHSHVIHIKGIGFPTSVADVLLTFDPPLVDNTDYIVRVVDRTELEVSLLDSKAWRSDAGVLKVTSINVRGDDAGLITLAGGGVVVAEIIDDMDGSTSGGVEVFPTATKVYQKALQEKIAVTGVGFHEGMEFVFAPALVKADYDLTVESVHKAVITLKTGKSWRSAAGDLIAKSVKVSGKNYPLAGDQGIRVAIVLADPQIMPSDTNYHESQSKLIAIYGTGFTNVDDVKLRINPPLPNAYMVRGVVGDTIRVQLKQDMDWLPSYMSLNDEEDGKKITLQVSSIDTGAGEITFPQPITIGYIIKDREGVTCDDSCEFAFDGVCDDGAEHEHYYGYYKDDDFGGFYDFDDEYDGDDFGGRLLEEARGAKRDLEEYYDDYEDYYDDYYGEITVSACVQGTDCTDCGGVDAIIDYDNAPHDVVVCSNTCIYSRDGVCDDSRNTNYCELGTDCQDCGPVGADNFTRADDDGFWDDDDDYWIFNDGNFLDQTKGLEANRDKVRVHHHYSTAESSGSMFLIVLEGMAYTIAAVVLLAALFILNRWYKGQPIPFVNAFNPDSSEHSFELAPTRRMPITPDVLRT